MIGHPPFHETYVKAELSVQVVFALLSEVHKQISRTSRHPSQVLVNQHSKLVDLLSHSITDTQMSYSGLMAALPGPDLRRQILLRAFQLALQKQQTRSQLIYDRLIGVGRLYYDLYKGEEVNLFHKEEQNGCPVAKKKRWLVLCNKRAGWIAQSQEEIESGVKWNLKTKYEVQSNQFLMKLCIQSAHPHFTHRKNNSFSAAHQDTLLTEQSSNTQSYRDKPQRGNSADARACQSSRTLPSAQNSLSRHKTARSIFQRKINSHQVEEQPPLRIGVSLVVSLQVSVQGAPFLHKHIPFIFTGAPIEFPLVKFHTSHDLEKVSVRHCFYLNFIASGLLNYLSSLCVEEQLQTEKLALLELGVVLESIVFREGEHNHSASDTKLRTLLNWLNNEPNRSTAKRDGQKELVLLLKRIEWGEVAQSTIREAKPRLRGVLKNCEEVFQEMEQELELRGNPMRSSEENPELQTTLPEKSQSQECEESKGEEEEEQNEQIKQEEGAMESVRLEKDIAYQQSNYYAKELQAKDEQIASLKNQILKLKSKKSKISTRGYELNEVSISSVDDSTNLVPVKSSLSVATQNMEDSDLISSFFISYAVEPDQDQEIQKIRKSLESPKAPDSTGDSLFSGLNTMAQTADASSPSSNLPGSNDLLIQRERSASLFKVFPVTTKANQRKFVLRERSEKTLHSPIKHAATSPVGINRMAHIHTPRKTAEPVLISQIKIMNDRARSPLWSPLRRKI